MTTLELSLFGKFTMQVAGQTVPLVDARKAQELFAYLLLYRRRSHHRERIASLLWSDVPDAAAKRYLSKALWQLQSALDLPQRSGEPDLFNVDAEWISIDPDAGVWLDIAVFEEAFRAVQQLGGHQLHAEQIQLLETAVALYQGELLEGWYSDWCILERQRLHDELMQILDKLIDYFEMHRQFENGLDYGRLMLHFDWARERTHRRLMRLYCLAGDRSRALRQYEQCVGALHDELQVTPSAHTKEVYERICAGDLQPSSSGEANDVNADTVSPALKNTLNQLHQLRSVVVEVQQRLESEIEFLEVLLRR